MVVFCRFCTLYSFSVLIFFSMDYLVNALICVILHVANNRVECRRVVVNAGQRLLESRGYVVEIQECVIAVFSTICSKR